MPGTPVRWPTSRSCGSFSTAPWCACGSTARRVPSRCSSLSVCARAGQQVLLAIKSMGGESAEAWRAVLDDLIKRGLRRPEFLIVDGAPGFEKAPLATHPPEGYGVTRWH